MATKGKNELSRIITKHEKSILAEWVREQVSLLSSLKDSLRESELKEQCSQFLDLLIQASDKIPANSGVQDSSLEQIRNFLGTFSRDRGLKGFSPSETAIFVFSLKKPLFSKLHAELGKDAESLMDTIWIATELLDKLGLYTTEVHQKAREEIINRQQQDMLELSTPVVSLAEGILALPVIGTLDSARTQVVMESLLQRIVETSSSVAIIDITGVPMVDTLVAQHLLKTVTAARLMGADCIISGIRPQIAQTIVHLGVELGDVTTKATLASAFKLALERNGMAITRQGKTVQEKH